MPCGIVHNGGTKTVFMSIRDEINQKHNKADDPASHCSINLDKMYIWRKNRRSEHLWLTLWWTDRENVVRLKVNVYLSFYVFNQSIQNWTIGNGQMLISNTMWPVLLSYLHYWLACKSSYFQCKIINFGNKVVLYL